MRGWIRGTLWVAGLLAVPLLALLGINALDESLTPQAKALLEMPKPPASSEKNGYVHLVGIGATGDDKPYAVGLRAIETLRKQEEPGFRWSKEWDTATNAGLARVDKGVNAACAPSARSCLEAVANSPKVGEAIAKYGPLMARYREIRAMPEYFEIYYPMGLLSQSPSLQSGVYQLSLATAAMDVKAGNLEAALRELEQENAFHRKVAANAALLATKFVSLTYLQTQALFISDLARTQPAAAAKYQARLQALVRPLSAAEADMTKVLRTDAANSAGMLRKEAVQTLARIDGGRESLLASWFYREGETTNLYAAQNTVRRKVADVPATQYASAAEAAKREADALVPAGGVRNLVNPVGRQRLQDTADFDVIAYVGRLHDTQGILALVSTQLALRAAGASKPDAIEKALAGALGAARPDPYTGKPMAYDAKLNTLGFVSPARPGSLSSALQKRFGRIAVLI